MQPQAARARPTLAARVAEQLERLIERGEYPRGLRLPGEFALCRRFGVSRPVLRGALALLRARGLVQPHKGSGTIVLKGPEPGAALFPLIRDVAGIDQYFEFRAVVEAEAARLAAERHTAADRAAIEAALAEAEELAAGGATELSGDVNFRFHRAIAAATGNEFHLAAVARLPNLIGIGPVEVRIAGLADPRARIAVILAEHRSIFQAVAARDAARAAAEMRAHIASARRFAFQRHPLAIEEVG
jgi:DNA-binding FadR family transcriptional regulator